MSAVGRPRGKAGSTQAKKGNKKKKGKGREGGGGAADGASDTAKQKQGTRRGGKRIAIRRKRLATAEAKAWTGKRRRVAPARCAWRTLIADGYPTIVVVRANLTTYRTPTDRQRVLARCFTVVGNRYGQVASHEDAKRVAKFYKLFKDVSCHESGNIIFVHFEKHASVDYLQELTQAFTARPTWVAEGKVLRGFAPSARAFIALDMTWPEHLSQFERTRYGVADEIKAVVKLCGIAPMDRRIDALFGGLKDYGATVTRCVPIFDSLSDKVDILVALTESAARDLLITFGTVRIGLSTAVVVRPTRSEIRKVIGLDAALMCWKCCRIGHLQAHCRHKMTTCAYCGNGGHKIVDCPKRANGDKPRCLNCGGLHPATSGACVARFIGSALPADDVHDMDMLEDDQKYEHKDDEFSGDGSGAGGSGDAGTDQHKKRQPPPPTSDDDPDVDKTMPDSSSSFRTKAHKRTLRQCTYTDSTHSLNDSDAYRDTNTFSMTTRVSEDDETDDIASTRTSITSATDSDSHWESDTAATASDASAALYLPDFGGSILMDDQHITGELDRLDKRRRKMQSTARRKRTKAIMKERSAYHKRRRMRQSGITKTESPTQMENIVFCDTTSDAEHTGAQTISTFFIKDGATSVTNCEDVSQQQ